MQIKGIRLYVVLAAVMLMLGLLVGAQYFYQRYSVEQPLFKLYSQTKLVDNIKNIKLEDQGSVISVTLALNKTENLRQAYQDLYRSTGQVLGSNQFQMQIKDTRTRELENVYYQSQFVIYEALVKGSYPEMAQAIERNARSAGAQARVYMDEKNIYVALYKGKNYLYEVLSRSSVSADKNNGTQIGSEQQ